MFCFFSGFCIKFNSFFTNFFFSKRKSLLTIKLTACLHIISGFMKKLWNLNSDEMWLYRREYYVKAFGIGCCCVKKTIGKKWNHPADINHFNDDFYHRKWFRVGLTSFGSTHTSFFDLFGYKLQQTFGNQYSAT